MHSRRPLAGLIVALTLSAGGAPLAGCSAPGNSRTGTPADSHTSAHPSNPNNPSQGNLPTEGNQRPGAGTSQGPGGP